MALAAVVNEERAECRREVFSALHDHYETSYCKNFAKLKDELTSGERKEVFEQTLAPYNELLRNLGAEPLNRDAMHEAFSKVPATAATDLNTDSDLAELDDEP